MADSYTDAEDIPEILLARIESSTRIVEQIGSEMVASMSEGKRLIDSENPSEAIEYLEYTYKAAVGFNNVDIAAESSELLVKCFNSLKMQTQAAEWSGRALRWRTEDDMKKKGESQDE